MSSIDTIKPELEFYRDIRSLEEKVKTLTEKLLEAFEELNIFYDINKSLNNIYNIEIICDITLSFVAEIVCSEKASIALVDENQEYLTIISYKGFDGNPQKQKIKIKNSLYEDLINNKKPVLKSDKIRPVVTSKEQRYKTDYFVLHPICALPMTVSQEIIGVVSLADKVDKKPFTAQDIKFISAISAETAVFIQNARLINHLKESFLVTVRSLSAAIDTKDPYTHGHSERVCKYALSIGKILEVPKKDLEQLELACLLHDIGKIGIPENILNKEGKLSQDEFDIIRQHPLKGVSILEKTKLSESVISIVRHHHERFDGHGYPDGLAGEKITLLAKIVTVADSYDAIVSDRPYRQGLSKKIASEEILKGSGSQFDPKVVWAFKKWIK